ncbi:MAG: exonuclease domain-containing protein [Clostridiales bacterium]|nr:exonuclease domain-containing protein [Clostridiales bacterium]
MAKSYTVLDIETTGLDAASNEIIEVAAVKIRSGSLEEEFSTLVKPKRTLPPEITVLTGIDEKMLEKAPLLEEIMPQLEDFVASDIIIAHNAAFDAAFLSRHFRREKEWLDSLSLAQIVYPDRPSYALASLADHLGLMNPAFHRALGDAKTAGELFLFCQKELKELNWRVQRNLLHLAAWDDPLSQMIRQNLTQSLLLSGSGNGDHLPLPFKHDAKEEGFRRKREVDECYQLAWKEVEPCLRLCGSPDWPGFEERPQQLAMAKEVTKSLNGRGHLLVEAGTGTGKSLAYLAPAALFSQNSGRQVAISTHTITLQEQLINKDIPLLSRILGKEIKAVLLKGRNNYLCLRLYQSLIRRNEENLRLFLMRLAVWLSRTDSGDSGELHINKYDYWKWQLLAASRENCQAPDCPFARGQCFVRQSRRAAEEADIFILNHSLLVANASLDKSFLPDMPYLLIDEAHHLERAAEEQLTQTLNLTDLSALLPALRKSQRGSILVKFSRQCEELFLSPEEKGLYQEKEKKIAKSVEVLAKVGENFFRLLGELFLAQAARDGFYPARLRLRKDWLSDPATDDASRLEKALEDLIACLLELDNSLHVMELSTENELSGREELHYIIDELRRDKKVLEDCLALDEENFVAWLEFESEEKMPGLYHVPIELGPILKNCLFSEKESLIFTSATLTAAGSFSYIKQRLGLDLLLQDDEILRELALASPFHYQEQALLTICNDLPNPAGASEIEYTAAVAKTLEKLLSASRGRAVVLFTSHYQLRAVYQALLSPLAARGLVLLAHGINGSRAGLLQRFKKEANCCLLGANSFWEGIDVVGEALSLVIVVRLPFWPPNSPTMSARLEKIEAQGGSSFFQYSLPQALIRFKQGFGRLIRSGEDRGVFCVLDRRIIEKNYGRKFITSLPQMKIQCANSNKIAETISKWLE